MKKNKNEPKFDDIAVAIKYLFGKDGESPKIVASGRGHIAKQIIDIANDNNIPLKNEKALAQSLIKVPIGVEIPPELWEAMAEILAQVYTLNKKNE